MQLLFTVFVICITLATGFFLVEHLTKTPEKPKPIKFGKRLAKHIDSKKAKND
jgi:hypothetical protein